MQKRRQSQLTFNTPFSAIDRGRQKLSSNIEDMNNTLKHFGPINIYRTLRPTTTQWAGILFKRTWYIHQHGQYVGS